MPVKRAGTTGSLRALRRHNRELLLAIIRSNGPVHRAELARRSGLSRSAVSTIVAELLQENILAPVVSHAGVRVGRGGELLALAPSSGLLAALDYGLRGVVVVVTDLNHTVVGERRRRLAADALWPERLEEGIAALDDVLAELSAGYADLRGVGLGIPDPVDLQSGTIGHSRSGPAWTNARAREALSERAGVPVAMDNTSHLAALGEVMWGAAAGARNVMYLKMSHGVGAGLLLNGEIYRGSIGVAGELGHFSVSENGPACPCGNRGCLELYAGGSALLDLFRPVRGDHVGLEDLVAAAVQGDRVADRLISDAGATTGRLLASVCNLLDPDLVVIGGDLAAAGELLLEPMRTALTRHALGLVSAHVKLVSGTLGQRAGALGGIALLSQGGADLRRDRDPQAQR